MIQPYSYKDIKDSIYFQEGMAKTKRTRKLTQVEKDQLAAGKQPRQPIPATPLRKGGHGNKVARNEITNTVKAGNKDSEEECTSNGRCQETSQVQTRDCGSP